MRADVYFSGEGETAGNVNGEHRAPGRADRPLTVADANRLQDAMRHPGATDEEREAARQEFAHRRRVKVKPARGGQDRPAEPQPQPAEAQTKPGAYWLDRLSRATTTRGEWDTVQQAAEHYGQAAPGPEDLSADRRPQTLTRIIIEGGGQLAAD